MAAMTLEVVHFIESIPEIPVDEEERLLLERELAQRRIGRASIELARANKEYSDAIAHSIQVNKKIADRAIDTSQIIARTQSPNLFYDDIHGFNKQSDQSNIDLRDELDMIS